MSKSENSAAADVWAVDAATALRGLDEADAALVARTEAWAAINTGSYELGGLNLMRAALADAFAALPGEVSLQKLAPSRRIRADGEVAAVEHTDAIRTRVRPDAPVQIALTERLMGAPV
jgi:glutamate carboxypeptidase